MGTRWCCVPEGSCGSTPSSSRAAPRRRCRQTTPTAGRRVAALELDGRLGYLGDWHTHPEREPSPSSWDLESMEDCFKKSRHQLKAFVMVIVGRAAFPEGLWVSLHDKAKWERVTLSRFQDLTYPNQSNSATAILG